MSKSSKNIYLQEVMIPSKAGELNGLLTLPEGSKGIVIFAHGSGSGRYSKRNQFVANVLNEASIGTLLMDLLTTGEEEIDELTRQWRFDINLLAHRLEEAFHYLNQREETRGLNKGYFGSSTGAAAALVAAGRQGKEVKAVVSRGGRPDLAGDSLSQVKAPTLLIVGGNDVDVIELNERAFGYLQCEKKMQIVAGATHLFEEPGALEEVAELAEMWFTTYL